MVNHQRLCKSVMRNWIIKTMPYSLVMISCHAIYFTNTGYENFSEETTFGEAKMNTLQCSFVDCRVLLVEKIKSIEWYISDENKKFTNSIRSLKRCFIQEI